MIEIQSTGRDLILESDIGWEFLENASGSITSAQEARKNAVASN